MNPNFKGNLLLANANVITMTNEPSAGIDSVLVKDGQIAGLGRYADLRAISKGALELDCAGKTLIPGFVDGHCHFEMTCNTAENWIAVHTPPYTSLDEIAKFLKSEVLRTRESDSWLLCRSSFAMQEKVDEKRLFSRQELDDICLERPLAVFASLHVASLNTAAFKALGLWDETSRHSEFGVVHRDIRGTPTGVVTEVFLLVPTPGTVDQFKRLVSIKARNEWNVGGTTSVYTMPETFDQAAAECDLLLNGDLSIRQRHYFILKPSDSLDAILDLARTYPSSDMIRFGGIKIFVNGCAHDGNGNPLDDIKWPQSELNALVLKVHALGLQLWMHSLNEEGVRMAGLAVQEAIRVHPAPHRHRIEHGGDYLNLADANWLRGLGIRLVTTPQFLHSTTGSLGSTHAPWRSLVDKGFHLIGGTDSTGTVPGSISVLANIKTAMTRRKGGQISGGEQRLSGLEALKMFTLWSAEGGFEDDRKGKMEIGCLGDFVLLSHDLTQISLETVDEVRVDTTVLGGEMVYDSSSVTHERGLKAKESV